MGEVMRPGEAVPESGIYRVEHDPLHTRPHEMTCLYGQEFPSCKICAGPKFTLVKAAHSASYFEWFK